MFYLFLQHLYIIFFNKIEDKLLGFVPTNNYSIENTYIEYVNIE